MKKLIPALVIALTAAVGVPGQTIEASWNCSYSLGNTYGSAVCSDDPGSTYRAQLHCIHADHFNWQQNRYGIWVTSGNRSYAACSPGWRAQWIGVQG